MLAIKLSLENLPLITELNNGVMPSIQKDSTYFIWTYGEPNDIMYEKDINVKFELWKIAHCGIYSGKLR